MRETAAVCQDMASWKVSATEMCNIRDWVKSAPRKILNLAARRQWEWDRE